MPKYKKGDIIEIYWIDTFGYNGWYTEEEIDEKTKTSLEKFVGYFIKETKDFIIICMGLEDNDEFTPYNSPKWIPKGFIKQIKILKSPKKELT